MTKSSRKPAALPSKADLLAFIRERPGETGTREIARAFNLKNADRAALKHMLRDLADEGEIEKRRKKLHHAGALPTTVLADVTERDSDGDLIATPDEWDEAAHGAAPKIRILVPRKTRPQETPGIGDRVLLRVEETPDDEGARYRGRVIKIIDRPKHRVLGIYRAVARGGGRIEPVDKKMLGKELSIPEGAVGDAQDGDLVAVETNRPSRFGLPTGRVVEKLGSLASERAVSLIAIAAHGIPSVFKRETSAGAEEAKPATLAHREDWRQLPLITIDPADAKDHDDAVHAEPDDAAGNKGGFILTVAIADVAHYVTPGSALDREAQTRGNSVYFPDRVVPMLPERISNDLCSLKENETRPCLAVRMVFDKDGRKRNHRFLRALMRSAASLAYQQAQAAIDGRMDDVTVPLLEPVLRPLWGAYASLVLARTERAPLDLDLPERKILLDEQGKVRDVISPPRLDAHRLIEEFMIAANVAAAETLEARRTPLIYRVHDAPSKEKLTAFTEFLSTIGLSLPKAGTLMPSHFNRILAQTRGSETAELVGEVVLRSQSQAEYAPGNFGHFGLNLRRYAHFTSPIRRYADLIVHRALIRALDLGPDGLSDGEVAELEQIAKAISDTERRAMVAERETADRLIAAYLADRIGVRFQARVSGLVRSGLFVRLTETGADGFVPASSIGHEYFAHDEARQALVGEDTGAAFQLGDSVEVKLVEAIPTAGALRFEMLSEGRTIGGKPKRRPAAKKGRPPQRQSRTRQRR